VVTVPLRSLRILSAPKIELKAVFGIELEGDFAHHTGILASASREGAAVNRTVT